MPHPTSTDPQASETFLANLAEQTDCWRELAKLAGEQGKFVASGDTERLLDLLQRREALTVRATQIESDLAETKRAWPTSASGWSDEARRQAEALFLESKTLLATITQRDGQDALILQQRKIGIGRELGDMKNRRQVGRRYAASAYQRTGGSMDVTR